MQIPTNSNNNNLITERISGQTNVSSFVSEKENDELKSIGSMVAMIGYKTAIKEPNQVAHSPPKLETSKEQATVLDKQAE